MEDAVEIDGYDEKFANLLEAKRHKEVLDAFKKVMLKLSSDNGNSGIAKSISSNTDAINGFIEKIGNLKFDSPNVNVQPPNVTVHQNQDKVVTEIKDLKSEIVKLAKSVTDQNEYLEELCRPKQWEFKVMKDGLSRLIGVEATQVTQPIKKIRYGT